LQADAPLVQNQKLINCPEARKRAVRIGAYPNPFTGLQVFEVDRRFERLAANGQS
jgi:hypothetical protein